MKNTVLICVAALIAVPSLLALNYLKRNQRSNNFKVGIALYSFNKHPFEQALDMVDSCGVPYIEGLSFYNLGGSFGDKTMIALSKDEIRRMKGELKIHHLTMPSMYIGDVANVKDWKRYFEIGKAFEVKYFVCEPPKQQLDMIDSLADVYNIKIAIHNHDKPDGYWSPDSVLAAMKGHKNIGACADIGHWAASGLDPVKCLKKLHGHVWGLHLKDIDKDNTDVVPGNGIINFDTLIAELKEQDFKGFVQVECEHNMDNNRLDVKKAVNYFNLHAQ